MFDILKVTLRLGAAECIRGESVPFEVVVENTTNEVLTDLTPFDPELRSVKLVAKMGKSTIQADQYSAEFRDGAYLHHPDDYGMSVTLRPKQKMSLKGDILPWFGELAAGDYEIVAWYMREIWESAPVSLKVLPAAPISHSVPRYATHASMSEQSAAWCHKNKKKGHTLFYQLQSCPLPRNPRVGIKVTDVDGPFQPVAAAKPYPKITKGHILWQDDAGKIFVCAADAERLSMAAKWELPLPFPGEPLQSPLSMPDGGLCIPFANQARDKIGVVFMAPDGHTDFHELDLGKTSPLGAYVCYWEYALRLHFAWAEPNGRQIYYGRLFLDDVGAGFLTESACICDDPIVWLEAYRDLEEPLQHMAYTSEQRTPEMEGTQAPPAPLMLWCVTRKANALSCLRVRRPGGTYNLACTFNLPDAKELRVVGSIVCARYHLHMLVADANDKLYYATTALRTIVPIAQAAGTEITLENQPALITPGMTGKVAWVHLRYINLEKSIEYVRLEPEDLDPVERAQSVTVRKRR